MPSMAYTLVLADVPSGFDLNGCVHNDKVRWGETELSTMTQVVKVVTTARAWSIILIHNREELQAVKIVLEQECNTRKEECIW
jgi:hypothetical protein